MKGYIRVLGSGVDAPTALVLMMENKRYLFNCGEGEYRVVSGSSEYRVKVVSESTE